MRLRRGLLAATLALGVVACGGGDGTGPAVRVTVPRGASFSAVADTLASHDIIGSPFVFKLYARVRGAAGSIQAGTYAFPQDANWDQLLDDLEHGRVLVDKLVIPEGWTAQRIANDIARITSVSADSVLNVLLDTASAARFDVPGPTLEGYLYPATYTLPVNAPLDSVLRWITERYRQAWTPARQARADSIDMTQREVVTLASIVEAEAKHREEMGRISSVYHNRLDRNYPLQADPTVQYALGTHQKRLLFAHIDSVSDNPYNTYTRSGLPPGPIGSASEAAIDAALHPDSTRYFYFVADPSGHHTFTRTLTEHNQAVAAARRLWNAARDSGGATNGNGGAGAP